MSPDDIVGVVDWLFVYSWWLCMFLLIVAILWSLIYELKKPPK